MGTAKDKLIHLHERAPQRALEGLNRVTGLKFRHWPESLVPLAEQDEVEGEASSSRERNRVMPG